MTADISVIAHDHLTRKDLERLGSLFDREYLATHGPWTPDAPYGYSPAQVHVMARDNGSLVGHVGFQPRTIAVGHREVLVAGTGGVLVTQAWRHSGLGARLMGRAREVMRDVARVQFGYLGCRPAVVPFYEAAGWHRIRATERHTSREAAGHQMESEDSPILICPARCGVEQWPTGVIDLRGGAW